MNEEDPIFNFQKAYEIAWRLNYGAWQEVNIMGLITFVNIN
jgi:hypothetical protein